MKQINYIILLIFQFHFIQLENMDTIGIILKMFEGLETKCYQELMKIIDDRKRLEKDKHFPWLGDALGKNVNDIGDEIECVKTVSNTTFIMVNFFELSSFELVQKANNDLIKFLDIKNFTIGVCIMKECKETIYRYSNIISNMLKIIDKRTQEIKKEVSFIVNDRYDINSSFNVYSNDNIETYTMKLIIIILICFFFGLKLIGGIIKIIFLPKGYDKYIAEKINRIKSTKEINQLDESTELSKKRKYEKLLIEESNTKEYNPMFDFTDKLPIYIKILKAFDIWDGLYYLSSRRNKYFNDIGLDIINFNRTIVIFFLIFSNTYSTIISLPTEEIVNESFFKSWLNIFYRLSNNALISWIFLEGAHTTYKMLCFITTEMFLYYAKEGQSKNNLSNRLLIILSKFLLMLFPKFIEFFCIYYIFYYKPEDFVFVNDAKATFTHVITNIFKHNIKCKSFSSIFNLSFSFDVEDYNTCYEFVHFYFNMFLCILLSMILIYLFFIIKKPIFEIIIMIINIVYFFISIALIKDKKNEVGQDLKEYNIVGNTYITKIFHSFLGCYNFGLVIGFLLFNFTGIKNRLNKLIYENSLNLFSRNNKNNINNDYDSSLDESLTNINSDTDDDAIKKIESHSSSINYTNFQLPYYPLNFLNQILTWLNEKSFFIKILLIIFLIIFFILIDFIFLIILKRENGFVIKITNFIKYLFIYEKHVFIIAFFFINVIMITLPKKGIIRDMMNSRIVVFVSRLGFLITCVSYAFTYFIFLIVDLRVKLFVPTFMVISLGNFLFCSFICFALYLLIELPLSIVVKKIIRIGRNKEKASL